MISFIVPAYNEELELCSTLAAIRAAASGAGRPCGVILGGPRGVRSRVKLHLWYDGKRETELVPSGTNATGRE